MRYNPSDFDAYIVDEASSALLSGRRTYRVGELVLSPNAQPNLDKFEALRANDPKFAKTVDRRRTDLSDSSPSGYDLALASIAVGASWTDQEIADLIIYVRRKHGDDLKLRPDYYARTISTARLERAGADAQQVLDEEVERLQATQAEIATLGSGHERLPHERKIVLELLCDALITEVTTVRCYNVEPENLWEVVTSRGPLRALTTSEVLQWTKVRSAIADRTKLLIPKKKADEWNRIVTGIMSIAEPIEIGIETTAAGRAYSWLNDYLGDRMLLEDRAEACDTKQPYIDPEGSVFIFGGNFNSWLWMSKGEKVNPTALGQTLRAFGCEYVKLNYQSREGKRSSASAWKVPSLGEFERPKHHKED